MKTLSRNKDIDIEENVAEPIENLRLKLIYKVNHRTIYYNSKEECIAFCINLLQIVFFAFGILATLTILILIRLSDNLVLEKKRQALRHFEEIASHVIEHQNHSV